MSVQPFPQAGQSCWYPQSAQRGPFRLDQTSSRSKQRLLVPFAQAMNDVNISYCNIIALYARRSVQSTGVVLSWCYLHPVLLARQLMSYACAQQKQIHNLEISAGKRSAGCNEHWKQTIQPSARPHWCLLELLHEAKAALFWLQRSHYQLQQ